MGMGGMAHAYVMMLDLPLPTLLLTYQSAGSILKPKMGVEEIYKPIRNRLRRYSATSPVELSLDLLWAKHGDCLQGLQRMPWLTLLVVKRALQDAAVNLRVGGRISGEELDAILQQLWASGRYKRTISSKYAAGAYDPSSFQNSYSEISHAP